MEGKWRIIVYRTDSLTTSTYLFSFNFTTYIAACEALSHLAVVFAKDKDEEELQFHLIKES